MLAFRVLGLLLRSFLPRVFVDTKELLATGVVVAHKKLSYVQRLLVHRKRNSQMQRLPCALRRESVKTPLSQCFRVELYCIIRLGSSLCIIQHSSTAP